MGWCTRPHIGQPGHHSLGIRALRNSLLHRLGDEIHVWFLALDGPAGVVSELRRWLDAVEREQATRYRDLDLADRYTVAHALVRFVLSMYCNVDPSAIEFTRRCDACGGPHGKPSLGDGSVRFSLSRSGNVAAVAVSSDDVGVDLERVDSAVDTFDLARRFYAEAEVIELKQLPERQRSLAFARMWTAKEAVLKAVGLGLSIALTAVEVSLRSGKMQISSVDEPVRSTGPWFVQELSPPPGLVGCVAGRARKVVRDFQVSGSDAMSAGSWPAGVDHRD